MYPIIYEENVKGRYYHPLYEPESFTTDFDTESTQYCSLRNEVRLYLDGNGVCPLIVRWEERLKDSLKKEYISNRVNFLLSTLRKMNKEDNVYIIFNKNFSVAVVKEKKKFQMLFTYIDPNFDLTKPARKNIIRTDYAAENLLDIEDEATVFFNTYIEGDFFIPIWEYQNKKAEILKDKKDKNYKEITIKKAFFAEELTIREIFINKDKTKYILSVRIKLKNSEINFTFADSFWKIEQWGVYNYSSEKLDVSLMKSGYKENIPSIEMAYVSCAFKALLYAQRAVNSNEDFQEQQMKKVVEYVNSFCLKKDDCFKSFWNENKNLF